VARLREQKIKIFRNLGAELVKRGHWILKTAFNIKTNTIPKNTLRNFISDQTGLSEDKIICHDNKYYLTDWQTWQEIIKIDWTNEKKYLKDRYDCDNFANSFQARMAEIFGLNSAGRFSVAIYDVNTDKKIGYHRASIIICSNNGILRAYAYDPMTGMEDKFCLIEKGKDIIIKNWQYLPKFISFN